MRRELTLSARVRLGLDLLLIPISIVIIQWLLHNNQPELFTTFTLSLIFLSTVCWLLTGISCGLYQDLRVKPFSYEWVVFIKTLIIYTLIISFISFQFFKEQLFVRWIVFLHCASIFVVFPFLKLAIRIIRKKIRNSGNLLKRVLIVGAGKTGLDFSQHCADGNQFGYKLTGFIDEEKRPSLNGKYLGKVSELEKVISQHELDDIVVAMSQTNETHLKNILDVGEKEGKRVHIIPDYQYLNRGRVQISQVGNLPLITLQSLPLDSPENQFYKRSFDILFSALAIIFLLSWLSPVIALLIKLTSKGPVFFRQERWGLNNKIIVCYKFRSMVACSKDVDENGKYLQAKKNDPRVTSVGTFLRKTSLDELPQLFNVLLGSMSLVGPRPHPMPLNIISKKTVEHYMMRNWVKPGITGWAQVKGFRGETGSQYLMKKRVEADIWYMQNWTLWLDLQIVVQTLVNMVKGDANAV